jgi:hypothetical protein
MKKCVLPKAVYTCSIYRSSYSLPFKTVFQLLLIIVSTYCVIECSLIENLHPGLKSLGEPCYLVYNINNPSLERATVNLMALLPSSKTSSESGLVLRCRAKRIERIALMEDAFTITVSTNAERN